MKVLYMKEWTDQQYLERAEKESFFEFEKNVS